MPKRTNPFGDHSSLQLKTHVGVKEVDQGVCQQVRMQAVYERTQQLLFSGMRQKAEVGRVSVDANDNVCSVNLDSRSDHMGFRQTLLGKNCELLTDKHSSEMPDSMDMDCGMPQGAGCDASGMELDCGQFLLPRAELGLRQPSIDQASSAGTSPLHEPMAAPSNAFQQMFLAQSKASGSLHGDRMENFTGACHNCRNSVSSREVMKCQFCENYICRPCARQCKNCFMHFCQLCSIINYDKATERTFCLSCSKA